MNTETQIALGCIGLATVAVGLGTAIIQWKIEKMKLDRAQKKAKKHRKPHKPGSTKKKEPHAPSSEA